MLAFAFLSVAYVCECQECLARLVEYHDRECIDMFRMGARLLDKLECSGNGKRLRPEEQGKSDLGQLDRDLGKRLANFYVLGRAVCPRLALFSRNREMLKGLREDEHSKVLWNKTLADAKKGWMSTPVPLSDDDVERFLLSPRFCIPQGRASRRGPPRMR